uniref:Uncharacterized protein n=1 Tax=Anguilla anguilla TaxID=7936 RepID=A0A0E9PR23_ANGAN
MFSSFLCTMDKELPLVVSIVLRLLLVAAAVVL